MRILSCFILSLFVGLQLMAESASFSTPSMVSSNEDSLVYEHQMFAAAIYAKDSTYYLKLGKSKTINNVNYVCFLKEKLLFQKDGKYGMLDANGKEIIPFVYDDLYVDKSVVNNRYVGMPLDRVKPVYEIERINPSALVSFKEGRFGLIRIDGEVLFKTAYDRVTSNGVFFVSNYAVNGVSQKTGAYFPDNGKILPVEYDRVSQNNKDAIVLAKDGKFGVLDKELKELIPFKFEEIQLKGMPGKKSFRVYLNGKYGWYSYAGKELIPPIYDGIEEYQNYKEQGKYKVENGEDYGLYDLNTQKMLIPVEFDFIGGTDNGLIQVSKNNLKGIYDQAGNVVLPVEYDMVMRFSNSPATHYLVMKNNYVGLVDAKGDFVLDVTYKSIETQYNQYLLRSFDFMTMQKAHYVIKNKENKCGVYQDNSGEITIPVKYDAILQKAFVEGLDYFVAVKDGQYGIVDETNKVIVRFKYDSLSFNPTALHNIVAKKGDMYGVINQKETTLIPFKYSYIEYLGLGLFKAKKDGFYHLIDATDNVLNPDKFDEISLFEDGEALAFKDGKMRVIDKDGAYLRGEVTMKPHQGFTTMEALKYALIEAMDSPNNDDLRAFAEKIAPTPHIIYFYKKQEDRHYEYVNRYGYIDAENIVEAYYKALLKIKLNSWTSFDEEDLLLSDYSYFHERGYISSTGIDPLFCSLFEELLRNSYRINGYWISPYFRLFNFQY